MLFSIFLRIRFGSKLAKSMLEIETLLVNQVPKHINRYKTVLVSIVILYSMYSSVHKSNTKTSQAMHSHGLLTLTSLLLVCTALTSLQALVLCST